MRILIVTNFYPPHFIGGYEIGCQEAANALQKRGHEVRVLTSMYKVNSPQVDDNVYRWLEADVEWEKLRGVRFVLKLISKEWVNFWNPSYISISLVGIAREQKICAVFYIFDDWLAMWESVTDSWFGLWKRAAGTTINNFAKKVLQQLIHMSGLLTDAGHIKFANVQFASAYLKINAAQAGKQFSQSVVIHWGIDFTKYQFKDTAPRPLVRLLFVGQLIQQKGVHTLVETMRLLKASSHGYRVCLDIIGGSSHADYIHRLNRMVEESKLQNQVKFLGMLPRERLIQVYHEHYVLLFPSIWNEPFGIVLLEAMAAGLPVVATATGGSSEILEHMVNCLIFEKDNPADCARQITGLLENSELFDSLRRNARHMVTTRFPFEQTFDRVEASLLNFYNQN